VTVSRPSRIAVLVKQVPRFEEMELGPDGRLVREGVELELNPYCRRAVSSGVTIARETGGSCTVYTLGPPAAEDVLREAVAWGADEGVLVSDPAFAGSDTLATARALAAALQRDGVFDLVLVGRNSVDADTGQVGPELAELLDMGYLAGARMLTFQGELVHARLEQDEGWVEVEADLPLVVSCAERLCEPCKVDPTGRAEVPAHRLRVVRSADLSGGPWGQPGSPTRVGEVRTHHHQRQRRILSGAVSTQVTDACELLRERGALEPDDSRGGDKPEGVVPLGSHAADRVSIAVVVEPGRPRVARELLGAAAELAARCGGHAAAIVPAPFAELMRLHGWGADRVLLVDQARVAEDVAAAVATWCEAESPWALLAPSTMWGRELAGRLAVRLNAGLTGDGIDLEIANDRLVAWKPAFGGQLVAAITSDSPTQMVTVRPGVLPLLAPRPAGTPQVATIPATTRGRVRVLDTTRDDDADILVTSRVVIGVGAGVPPERHGELDGLATALGGTLAATRKVTDKGWLPHSRQVGITGRSIAPDLYVAVAVSGKFNHMIGVRGAGTILAINNDPTAPVFDACDIGIVGDWTEVVPLLVDMLEQRRVATG
jgi:electron transfer flavoprotein alpha subunit